MEVKEIKQEIDFETSCAAIYEMLMDSEKHSGFTGAPAEMSQEVGGKFSCYGDYIQGKNLTLIPGKKIVQTWRGKDFPKGHFSKVTFELTDSQNKKCKLLFTHEDVPTEKAKDIENGWNEHYWDKMHKALEN